MKPPDEFTELRGWPAVTLRLACRFCGRGGIYRVADIAAKHGSRITVGQIIAGFISTCAYSPWSPARKPQKYGAKCGGHCADLRRSDPPDQPPGMVDLTLIEGGKDDRLPSDRPRTVRSHRH